MNKKQTFVTLDRQDSCFERARKILQIAGVVDHVGINGRMAEAIEIYKNLDQQISQEQYQQKT